MKQYLNCLCIEFCTVTQKINLYSAEVFHYFALYMEDRQFFKAFIAQAPFERRQLINATLNRDQFFNIAMKYLSRDQHTQILLGMR